MRLLIVRHGATANNAEARFTGQSDVGLSALGERQAVALAERLRGAQMGHIVASDLVRARVTAEAVAHCHDLPVALDPDLREISMGAWEGMTFAEIATRDPEGWAQWRGDTLSYAPPDGETAHQALARMLAAFDRWHAAHAGATVLWVTHGGVIGLLVCHLLGMDLMRRWQLRRDNASLTELEANGERITLHRLNDTAHLDGMSHDDGIAEKAQVL